MLEIYEAVELLLPSSTHPQNGVLFTSQIVPLALKIPLPEYICIMSFA